MIKFEVKENEVVTTVTGHEGAAYSAYEMAIQKAMGADREKSVVELVVITDEGSDFIRITKETGKL